ncbi:hypothetical protein [Cohnella yongneupensis]|uniref:Uncharacterized protein n=1 Tax=Cohnella yongneupensis TaxID=425006 RepID=A0ABW0R0V2_9BACL
MRQLLMTVLLLLTVVGLYTNLVSGEGGTKAQLSSSSTHMAIRIAKMSP